MRPSTTLGRLLTRSALLVAFALAFTFTAQAATITVDSGTDDGVGCTLREAVQSANTDSAVGGCTAGDGIADEIQFSVGAITLTAGQIAITEGVTVTGPVTITAAASSRIFRIDGSEVVSFSDITFQNGQADGGALFITDSAPVVLTGGAFNMNAAPVRGGAIYVSASGSLTVNGTSFTGNQARGDAANEGGGAIYTNGGTVNINEATFTDNRALGTSGSGGAILNPNGATLDVTDSAFTGNRSQRAGGAIETVNGSTQVTGGTFEGNTAGTNPGNGGAIHGGGSVDVSVFGTTARGNRANEGGAYWISSAGTMALGDVIVEGNIAEGASADQGGGGVYVDGGTLSVTNVTGQSTFSDNRAIGASGSGGAILVNGGSVTIDGTVFMQNRAQRAGGAIEFTAPASDTPMTATIDFATFTNNITGRAPGNGGGIHTTTGDLTMTIDNANFSGNEAWSEGGGLWINTGTTATVTAGSFTGNAARGLAADNGGGALFNNGGSLTVLTSTVSGNRTYADGVPGGGLLAVGGTTAVMQSLFTENYASNGGGVASLNGATVMVHNSTLYGNTARFGGGGFSGSGFLSFDSATIASNSATIGGGGLYNQNTPNQGTPYVTLTNTIVADNSATNGANLKGRHTSAGWNVIGTTPDALTFAAVASDQLGTDPMLGALADNGGPTLTAALMAGSPAIDAGSTALTIDQRGVARTEPDDVGAVEFGDAAPPATASMIVTGVFDGPLSGGNPKVIELYVLDDIADLSAYGVSSANNGGGPTGAPEFTFPADAASAGDYIYVSAEAPGFLAFFGFDADYVSGAASINGDDAIEVFFNGEVIDVYGDVNVDGTGQPWDTVDGWAYRVSGTGPDGDTFVLENFTYSGVDANDDDTSQDTATNPWPIGTYAPAMTVAPTTRTAALATTLDALTVVPNPFRSSARASFAVSEAQAVTVTLYDVMGRQVQQVFSGAAQAEQAIEVSVDGSSLAAGVYVLVLQGETMRSTRQVTVAR